MNRKHLGDALDHWKGSLIASLRTLLDDVHVVPMFTDEEPEVSWRRPDLRCYAGLLRVSRNRILHGHRPFQASDRGRYFSELRLCTDADVFLDPDIGIARDGRGDTRHVRPKELETLLPPDSPRIVLVYQHSSRTNDFVEASLRRVVDSRRLAGTCAFAYDAGKAAMIFVSRFRRRLREVHKAMTGLFGITSRVTKIHCASLSAP